MVLLLLLFAISLVAVPIFGLLAWLAARAVRNRRNAVSPAGGDADERVRVSHAVRIEELP